MLGGPRTWELEMNILGNEHKERSAAIPGLTVLHRMLRPTAFGFRHRTRGDLPRVTRCLGLLGVASDLTSTCR
jgi:hypothetical protein